MYVLNIYEKKIFSLISVSLASLFYDMFYAYFLFYYNQVSSEYVW